MKKIILTFVLLLSVMCGVMAQNDAVYVYRNDGQINAFLKADVDSMRYSHLDADSIYHNDWQMHEIFTPDSTYRIPIAAIDSISFVTPPIEYQKDVVLADDDLLKYIISYTDYTLTLRKETPSYLMPSVGEVFVSQQYVEPLPKGFAGRLVSTEQTAETIVCRFEDVSIGDIYSHLVIVGKGETTYEDDVTERSKMARVIKYGNDEKIKMPPEIKIDASLKHLLGEHTDVGGGVSVKLTNPKLTIDYFVCWGEPNIANAVKVIAQLDSEGNAAVNGTLSGSYEPEPLWDAFIPITFGPIGGDVKFGVFVEASGDASLEYSQDFSFRKTFGVNWNENMGFMDIGNKQTGDYFKKKEPSVELSLNGSVFAGIAADFSLGLVNENCFGFDVLAKLGAELSASFKLASSETGWNTNLYDALKNTEITNSVKLKIKPRYSIFFSEHDILEYSATFVFAEDKRALLPSFSDIGWQAKGSKSGVLTATVTKDTFLPVSLGWSLVDADGKCCGTSYYPDAYQLHDDWRYPTMEMPLSDLPANYNYKAYPTIKLWRWEIPANVYAEVVNRGCPVHVTDLKVTKSYHKEGAYSNDNLTYSYKFDAATTVSIDDVNIDLNGDGMLDHKDGIADWGYVYEDLNGKMARISLKSHSFPHVDTNYAYYRNSSSSSARLYGYIRYIGDKDFIDDTPHDFPLVHKESYLTCPDNHHPHTIDLGLPSGTKWCCMNVGATSPEGYGGYYAWGETEEKDVYDWKTYAYKTSSGDYKNIGSDIAGTSYDVAHVRMGGSWRMPTRRQQMELYNNCTREWTTQNGVNGILLTGKNGGHIFLPAAGLRTGSGLYDSGSGGRYWSSSHDEDYAGRAYYLSFNSGRGTGYGSDCGYGLSVRAVCP